MRHIIPSGRLELFRSLPLLRDCTDRELTIVDSLVDDAQVPAGKVIIAEGRLGQDSFLIVSGSATVTVRGRQIASLGPGDFFGEMALLGRRPLRVATVKAHTPMHLLVIEPGCFSAFLGVGGVAKNMLKSVVHRLAALEESIA